jgi:hypothetical protein
MIRPLDCVSHNCRTGSISISRDIGNGCSLSGSGRIILAGVTDRILDLLLTLVAGIARGCCSLPIHGTSRGRQAAECAVAVHQLRLQLRH